MSLKKGLGRVTEEESNSENDMEPSDPGAVYLGIAVAKQKKSWKKPFVLFVDILFQYLTGHRGNKRLDERLLSSCSKLCSYKKNCILEGLVYLG